MPVVRLQSPPPGIPTEIELQEAPKLGGEGWVYFSRDGLHAVKVYHQARDDKEQLLRYVMQLFESLPADQAQFLLPPLALVENLDGHPRVGFIMRRVPARFSELLDFVLNPVVASRQFKKGVTWANYLKAARGLADAVVALHGKGCAHSDIHFRNFLTDLEQGETVMLEIDGVVVAGFLPPQVKGMMGFMAPEILTRGDAPSERTDRHSLAVLILHTLLFRNVMLPLVEYDDDPGRSEELGWGEHALFSEDRADRRHRPRNLGLPLYRGGALSYRILTPPLQRLAERALVDGLRSPDQRPSAREWEAALARAFDELWACTGCGQRFPYPSWVTPAARRSCPFCGDRIRPPLPAVVDLYEERTRGNFTTIGHRLVLGEGFRVFADAVEAGRKPSLSRKGGRVAGRAERDPGGGLRLVNDDAVAWNVRALDGSARRQAGPGESVPLTPNTLIHFGPGRRLGLVVEAGGGE